MRKTALLIAASMALATAGCVESMDAGYPSGAYAGDGYESSGYYASYPSGYYTQPTALYAPTQVVTDVRYVPVPRGPMQADARTDGDKSQRHWDNGRADVRDHGNSLPPQSASHAPSHSAPHTPTAAAPARTAQAAPSPQPQASHQPSASHSNGRDDHHGNQHQGDSNNR